MCEDGRCVVSEGLCTVTVYAGWLEKQPLAVPTSFLHESSYTVFYQMKNKRCKTNSSCHKFNFTWSRLGCRTVLYFFVFVCSHSCTPWRLLTPNITVVIIRWNENMVRVLFSKVKNTFRGKKFHLFTCGPYFKMYTALRIFQRLNSYLHVAVGVESGKRST